MQGQTSCDFWLNVGNTKCFLSINDSLVSRVVEIAYPRKISRFERDYHQRSEFSSNSAWTTDAVQQTFTRKLSLIFRGEMWWFNDAWGSNHYGHRLKFLPSLTPRNPKKKHGTEDCSDRRWPQIEERETVPTFGDSTFNSSPICIEFCDLGNN